MLLDTHVWVWAVSGGREIGRHTRRRLEQASARASSVCVSTVSVFEIVALHTANRLAFATSVERWIHDSIEQGGLRVLDLERDIAVDAGAIPATALADPVDRCLVATARHHGIPLVTRDRRILDYVARTRRVRVIDASH